MYAAAKELNAKRTARAVKRAKTAKRKPDQFKVGFLACYNVLMAEGRDVWSSIRAVKKIAMQYRKDLGIRS